MNENSYYVYALKDPRRSPALPFYIGKGTGSRENDHLVKPEDTRKGKRIQEIIESGNEVLVTRLVDEISEVDAYRIEAELISAFGTEETGGILTNTIIPTGERKASKQELILPSGAKENAHLGLSFLKKAVLEFAKANPKGVTNANVASYLNLRSDYGGGAKDYLTYSILGLLMKEGLIERIENSKLYKVRIK
ncbi:GIY-YIG nuclease family protein [Priestia aryabhattai]|uniref:GIY-YIG nuclease family protein n=1 Tax=Priestia aryabhattai TaxID=412384 RepID=UPI003D7FE092